MRLKLFFYVAEDCVFCGRPLVDEACNVLGFQGFKKVRESCKQRKDTIEVYIGQSVHKRCRRDYTNAKEIQTYLKNRKRTAEPGPARRSTEQMFDPRKNCLFCGVPVDLLTNKKGFEAFKVSTLPNEGFQKSTLEKCKEREDEWSRSVSDRIQNVCRNELFAYDCVYHSACAKCFQAGWNIPARFKTDIESGPKKPKLSQNQCKKDIRDEAFLNVCKYLEDNDDEQLTMSDLVSKMEEYCNDKIDAYSKKHMKRKIIDHFGEEVLISNSQTKEDVVTLKSTAKKILSEYLASPELDSEEDKKQVLLDTAAKLIKNDIKGAVASKDCYPDVEDIRDIEKNVNYVPESLRLFLKVIFVGSDDLKIAAIGQAIMQAARPKAILAPLQVGFSVQMHHKFGSRFLNNTIYKLGFGVSYDEVQKFEVSAANTQGTHIPGITDMHHIQYIADNVDHNICTIDGYGTFHGMGSIATITPGIRLVF